VLDMKCGFKSLYTFFFFVEKIFAPIVIQRITPRNACMVSCKELVIFFFKFELNLECVDIPV
jgi:hypothetical protein